MKISTQLVLKCFAAIWLMCALPILGEAQLTGTGCEGLTQYTNGSANDPIYYYLNGVLGSLTATPPSGTPGWNFVWSKFVVGTSSWTLFSTEINVASSTISNLAPGAYSVTILDGTGVVVGCYEAWISQIIEEPNVDIEPIASGCTGPIMLNGVINYGAVTPYSNLPATQMLVDANTSISVCFSGTHTWVSDLAFYVIGPSSCGSPTLLLMPNPGVLGQNSVCNSGDNISNFCFSTESTNNINVCASAPSTLSGTYGTYGPSSTSINWSTLYGCETSAADWSVQIYDCIGGDTGSLTDATVTFSGTDACGSPQTITYTTPPGYNSGISDLSCSSGTASIFTVPALPAPPAIACEYGFEWNSEPYVYIADSTTSLNIQLDQLIDASGNVMPWQNILFTLEITSTCDSAVADGGGCFGGDTYDEEMFNFVPSTVLSIDPVQTLCTSSPAQMLIVNAPGGNWSGIGIVDPVMGLFDPSVAGVGTFEITYSTGLPCDFPASTFITVELAPTPSLVLPNGLCVDANPVTLSDLTVSVGTYSGPGIVDATLGAFNPAIAGVGVHPITLSIDGICPASVTETLEVWSLPTINAGTDEDVCQNSVFQLTASGAGTLGSYSWSPSTYLSSSSIFNPTASLLSDMTYVVVGTNINGCSSQDNIHLTLLPGPEVSVNPVDLLCPGAETQLVATGTIGNYQWTPAAGLTGANSATASASPEVTTTYTVTLTDACNLQVSATLEVPVELTYDVAAGTDVFYCEGANIDLNGNVVGASPIVEWLTTNGNILGNANALQITVDAPGDYLFRVTTPNSCIYEDAVHVYETPLPNLNLVNDTKFCPNGSVILHAGYNWDAVLWSQGASTPDITVDHEGIYSVIVTQNNCQSSDSIVVNEVILPFLELGPDVEMCQGEVVNFYTEIPGTWNTGITSDVLTVSTTGTYQVAINVEQCSTQDSVHVLVHPLPFVELGPPLVGCLEQPVSIDAYSPENATYLWSTGETTDFISVLTPDMYFVTVENECGTMTDFVDVNFEDCSYAIYMPNTFTPDYDGINDVWQMSTFNVKSMKLEIMNRWGVILYSTTETQAVWTGQVDDGDYFVPDGVYVYHLTYETELLELGERRGSILVIR